MKTLFISPLAAMLALLAPSSMAAHGTVHAFQGALCVPSSGSGAVYYSNGVSAGKLSTADVICPLSRTLSLAEAVKPIAVVSLAVSGAVSCTLYLTDDAGVSEYTATTSALDGQASFFIFDNLYSRIGRLSCHLPYGGSIRSYQLVDSF
jgi:hypothetical protein